MTNTEPLAKKRGAREEGSSETCNSNLLIYKTKRPDRFKKTCRVFFFPSPSFLNERLGERELQDQHRAARESEGLGRFFREYRVLAMPSVFG